MWRNIITKPNGETVEFQHSTNEGDAKAWNQALAEKHRAEVRLEHVADGPYDHSGKVTHIQTTNGNR